MRRTSLVFRLFVMAFMAIGLGTLMASPAAAQSTQVGQCQTIIEGVIDQQDCTIEIDGEGQCQVVVGEDIFQNAQGCGIDTCPRQIIAEGNIFQFQCGDVVPPTDVPATEVPPTSIPLTPVPTDVPATEVPPTDVPATEVPPTDVPATEVPPTDVPATSTATPDDDGDDDGMDDGDDDGGQANPDDDGDDNGDHATAKPDDKDKEMEVSVLPSTGQGSDGGDSNSANMLLLGAMGAVLTLGAVAMRLRNNS